MPVSTPHSTFYTKGKENKLQKQRESQCHVFAPCPDSFPNKRRKDEAMLTFSSLFSLEPRPASLGSLYKKSSMHVSCLLTLFS